MVLMGKLNKPGIANIFEMASLRTKGSEIGTPVD